MPYFPYCAYCSCRNGTSHEAAHNQSLHSDAYTFGQDDSGLAFNRRSEENRMALKERTKDSTKPPREDEVCEDEPSLV